MKLKYYFIVLMLILMSGCALPPSGPPVSPSFVFTPPTSLAATKNSMSIATLMPGSKGSFFEMYRSDAAIRPTLDNFLRSYQTDLEKIILAKGFTSSGSYPTYDEMTFSQKENASLIMRPEISFNIIVQHGRFGEPSTATVSGSVVIEFLEPMSKEKVWIKHFDLPETTQTVQMALLRRADGGLAQNPDGSLQYGLTSNSTVTLLNSFYATAFGKIWNQLDAREIMGLKADADKLKRRTNYRAN
jgi:hypothetical protein